MLKLKLSQVSEWMHTEGAFVKNILKANELHLPPETMDIIECKPKTQWKAKGKAKEDALGDESFTYSWNLKGYAYAQHEKHD